jgi:hypothetical protein
MCLTLKNSEPNLENGKKENIVKNSKGMLFLHKTLRAKKHMFGTVVKCKRSSSVVHAQEKSIYLSMKTFSVVDLKKHSLRQDTTIFNQNICGLQIP